MSQPPELDSPAIEPVQANLSARLNELARLFLKLGAIGFGGPQAHIAMIHDEAVVRRGWLKEEQFLEGVAICEMLPGPASTQTGIYTGYLRAGHLGALVAGVCFILPAFLIVLTLSWAYFKFQGVPQIEDLFLGISPVVIAIIFGFCWKLGKKAIKDWQGVAIALTVLLLSLIFRVNILLLFLLAGLAGLAIYRPTTPPPAGPSPSASAWFAPLLPITQGIPNLLGNLPVDPIAVSSFWGLDRIQDYFVPLSTFFLKTGAFIFGGGLVIIPLLETAVVDDFGWMTRNQFIDGVALGELTPGPVVITAAFVGYKVAGALGALVATIAIFTPSFLFIMFASPFLVRLRQNPWAKSFLKGVMPAVLGAIAAAAIPLAAAALLQDTMPKTVVAIAVGLAALIALVRFRRPTWQLVPAGALIGLIAGALT
ncbi:MULTISPECIES: chromate efflux transporter [Cyanophyceae]|uniref:chromate efflux transporter n=1 Tax=Cyanophyceae TaxID=3028117 RepID=UPI0016847293|nr:MULTISPECIES: chromate efflux transporter [Cyanophyceae]MBD1916079.1 chromate efflux transporter [Phormidium sp. FACHB-77]MBD2031652.1 chromate efflux transporter [Phormidium sp. FACHB-322]MBD2052721.1 chromate efflux transporter [Leptolyngbya sp. FACHB-60]